LSVDSFEIEELLGQGGFGKVYLVRMLSNNKKYAMKVMEKKRVLKAKTAKYVLTERNIFFKLDNPFIIKFYRSLQTNNYLYLFLEYCKGGDLGRILKRLRFLDEETTKIIAAQLVLAIEHLHKKGILYR
jgi:serine/threonine protein kinase